MAHQGKQANIPTNLRTLMILEELARFGEPATPTEINAAVGLPKPTIHRLFATLEAEGFVQREIDGRYFLPGPRLRKLASHVLTSSRARDARLVVLNRLAEAIGETCNLSVPDRQSMVYLERIETKWPLRIQLPVGSHVPLYCTASGKLYLSSLSDAQLERYLKSAELKRLTGATITDPGKLRKEIGKICTQGFSQDDEEFMAGMIAIAVPIHNDQKRLVATLSFHAPTMRLNLSQASSHLPLLRDAAAELEAHLLG